MSKYIPQYPARYDDVIGVKFDHITILKRREDLDFKNTAGITIIYYEYECDCPDHTHGVIRRGNLLNSKATHFNCRVCAKNRRLVETNIGKKFGRLTILRMAKSKVNASGYHIGCCYCKCECGYEGVFETNKVIGGNTKSCGCYQIDRIKETNTKHGLSTSSLYMIFHSMIDRCYNPNNKHYKYYGGKNPPIKICGEWYTPEDTGLGFSRFAKWSYSNGYIELSKNIPKGKRLSIERKDPNGDYCPENCTWILLEDQMKNTTRNIKIFDGEEKLIETDFERKYNCKTGFARGKRWRNWHPDAIVYAAKHPELGIRRTCMEHTQNHYIDKNGFQRLIPTVNNKLYHELEEKYRKN